MIKIENVHKHFGGFRAVDGATLEIKEVSITGLIGPNGAGNSTL
ncbi:MAG: ABC transporter ATP-binding protein, partial [Paracoccaceae bacterium]